MTQQTLSTFLNTHAAAGVFKVSDEMARNVFRAATEVGFNAWQIDASKARNSQELLSLLGRALRFPDWYGENWDALADCLTDLSWCEAEGHILLIHGLATLQQNDAAACQTLIEVLRETSLLWREEGVAFWALIENKGVISGLEVLPFKN